MRFQAEDDTQTANVLGQLGFSWSDIAHGTRTSTAFISVVGAGANVFPLRAYGSGGVSINSNTDPGAGVLNATQGYWAGNVAPSFGATLRSDGASFKNQTTPLGAVTSTTDQTATAETMHFFYTLPANAAIVGSTYRITAWGNIDNGTTPITYTPRIKWGGTAGATLIGLPTILGTTTALTNKDWYLVANVTIRTTGTTGTAVANMSLSNHTAQTSGAFSQDQATSGATAVTLNTAVTRDFGLSWQMSATTGTPHVRTFGGYIEVQN
jgi:hypothetical protein